MTGMGNTPAFCFSLSFLGFYTIFSHKTWFYGVVASTLETIFSLNAPFGSLFSVILIYANDVMLYLFTNSLGHGHDAQIYVS